MTSHTLQRPRIAARMRGIEPFHVMDLVARAHELEAEGRSVIHMEVGEPDFVTAQPIVDAGKQALDAGRTGYTAAAGIPPLRRAIAQDYYGTRFGLDVSPARILVTPGASGALQLVSGVLVNPGDRVLMADPGYPCNRHFVRVMGGDSLPVPVGADTAYQLTPELVQRYWTSETVAVLLASPSNPTGTVVSAENLAGIIDVAVAHGGAVIVDEIYQALTYDIEPHSALAKSDAVFVVNSFSKYFGMTGWRLGWVVVPEGYQREVEKLAQNLFLAPSTVAQYAALAAFSAETQAIVEARRQKFQMRRDFLLPALRNLGFEIPRTPEGAFYLYADCSAFTKDSFGFCTRAIEQANVAITPGIDFGDYRANEHIRFAYTNGLENLAEGVGRLRTLVASA